MVEVGHAKCKFKFKFKYRWIFKCGKSLIYILYMSFIPTINNSNQPPNSFNLSTSDPKQQLLDPRHNQQPFKQDKNLNQIPQNNLNVDNSNQNVNVRQPGLNNAMMLEGQIINPNLSTIQQNFWQSLLLKQTSFCPKCYQLKHSDNSLCKHRCSRCRGNHDSKACNQPNLCSWCGNPAGIHNCVLDEFKSYRVKCALCKARGHAAKDCCKELMALGRIANSIRAIWRYFKTQRKPKRLRRRFRRIKRSKK